MPVFNPALRDDYERLMARYEELLAKSRDLVKVSRGMYGQSQTVRDRALRARKGWKPRILKRPEGR